MKGVLAIAALLFVVSVHTSCKDKEVTEPKEVVRYDTIYITDTIYTIDTVYLEPEKSKYEGTWNYTKIDLENGKLVLGGNTVGSFTGKGKDIKGTVIMSENPNLYTTSVEFTAEITVLGQTRDVPVDTRTSSGTWEEVNGELILTDDNGNNVDVISSSESQIVFKGDFKEEIVLPLGAVDAEATLEFTVEK